MKLYRLIGGSHFFPPYSQKMDQPSDVPYIPNFDGSTGVLVTDIIWNFLNTHPMP